MNVIPVLNISQFNALSREGSFYANRFSTHIRHHHEQIHAPHKHDFYLVVLFLKGNGVHEVDFQTYDVSPGSLFLLTPGQFHHWEFSPDIEGYIFFHSQEFYNLLFPSRNLQDFPIFLSHQNSPFLQIPDDQMPWFEAQFESIYKEFGEDNPMKYRKMGALIELIYIESARLYIASSNLSTAQYLPKNIEWFQKLEVLIDEHYVAIKEPSRYAEMLNISDKHLNRSVQKTVGKTTTELIHDRVILEAKRLLSKKANNIQQVAFALGFEDASYFSRFFKKKCGYSPRSFQERYENER